MNLDTIDAKEEIAALIETLHETGQRLEELTAGEVDTVANREGQTYLLQRAQEHLRHIEAAKQAAILNALPANIALLDAQGRIVSVNETWRRFAGANALLSPEYGVSLNYLEVCDGARGNNATEATQAAAGIRSVLAGTAKNFSLEYPCHSPTEHRWFLMTVTPLSNEQRNGAVVMHLNITVRRQTEAAHKRLNTELRVLFDLMPAMIWFKDTQNGILRVNQHVAEAAGKRVEEIEGKPTIEIYPEHAAKYFADDREVIDSGVPKLGIIETLSGPHGEQLWVQTDKVPYHDPNGKVLGIVVMAQDITERVQAEQKLRESERRFTDMLENVELVSVMRDREERITYCNEYLLLLTGWKREEVIGRNWIELFLPPEIAEEKKRLFAELLLDKPETRHHESEILTRTGMHRLIHWNNSVLRSAQGEVIGTASIGADITEIKLAEQALQSRELEQRQLAQLLETERFRLVAAQRIAKIGSWETDVASLAVIWSAQTHRIFETDPGKFRPTHQAFLELVHPDDRAAVDDAFFKSLEQSSPCSIEHRILMPDGRIKFVEEHWQAYSDDPGHPVRAFGSTQDVTDRKATEAKIIYLNRVYAVLSGINTLIVRTHDRDELFSEACRIAVEAGGFRMAMIGIVDRNAMKIVPVATAGKDEELVTAIKKILSSGELAANTMVARAIREKQAIVSNDSQNDPQVLLGKKYTELGVRSIVILPLIVADKAVGALALYASEMAFFHEAELNLLAELAGDIAYAIDHLDKQERLKYLAYYDALTGLANRSLFLERLEPYMRSATRDGYKLAIGLIDLERFKNINDSLGWPVGDALLKQVAEWMTHKVGDARLLAHIDADHFAVVLPEVKSDGSLARLVENLLAAFLEHSFRLNDLVLRIGIKVGVALFPDDGADADTLFRNAETSLKMAEKSGDRYLFHTKKMTAAVAAKLTLENQLRQAIDNEEFVLHYQPKVNLASGKVTSAEALIRWNDPRTGLVPPGKFIPILEETGLINEVGRWALRKTIEENLRWRSAGLPAVRIAVNVSPLQLRNPGFIAEIERKIGIDPHAAEGLELEITESMIMEDVTHSITSLKAIRAMGITIAIDDFGTGFSSLGYLSKLPIDTLKINRSFVIEMTVGPEGLALVSTIVTLAHALKLKVVAEGVETEEQARLLRLLSCDEMQGFLFSKPVPAEIFEAKFLAPSPAGNSQNSG
jgi:diguanylate cyclase (GGDEF)-like protein/PAS domain S-box-containing protein